MREPGRGRCALLRLGGRPREVSLCEVKRVPPDREPPGRSGSACFPNVRCLSLAWSLSPRDMQRHVSEVARWLIHKRERVFLSFLCLTVLGPSGQSRVTRSHVESLLPLIGLLVLLVQPQLPLNCVSFPSDLAPVVPPEVWFPAHACFVGVVGAGTMAETGFRMLDGAARRQPSWGHAVARAAAPCLSSSDASARPGSVTDASLLDVLPWLLASDCRSRWRLGANNQTTPVLAVLPAPGRSPRSRTARSLPSSQLGVSGVSCSGS